MEVNPVVINENRKMVEFAEEPRISEPVEERLVFQREPTPAIIREPMEEKMEFEEKPVFQVEKEMEPEIILVPSMKRSRKASQGTKKKKRCKKGKRRSKKTRRCNKKCADGYTKNPTTRRCVKKN
jgi:hypothetical protein